jgi:hypothetical protein
VFYDFADLNEVVGYQAIPEKYGKKTLFDHSNKKTIEEIYFLTHFIPEEGCGSR